MAVESFPVEAGHVLMFARSIGDPNPVYRDAEQAAASEVGGLIAPPTFVQASAQFDPGLRAAPPHRQAVVRVGPVPVRPAAPPRGEARPRATASGDEAGGEAPRPAAAGPASTPSSTTRTTGPSGWATCSPPPPRPGERWEKQGRRAGVLVFAESITEYRDQHGELVVTARGVAVRTERAVSTDAPKEAG